MRAFWNFVTNDWYFAVPMFAMSLASITLVVWRFLLNRGADTDLNVFLPAFQERLAKDGVDGAIKYCREAPGVIPRKLYVAGLETAKFGSAAMRRAMANVIELEILPELHALLPLILAIAKIATMVGLLGTVISMIGTFTTIEEITQSKSGEVAGQAGKIGLALFATALGLIIAIPLVFAHVLFKAWIVSFDVKLKNAAQKLLTLMQASKPTAAAPAATTPKTGSGEVGAVSARK
jgi:biopolymer transport protein ExbB